MHTLYWAADTGAFAVQAVLEELGIPYGLVPVATDRGEHQGEAYRRLNPMAQVPTLRLPDGTLLTESAAMVLHLAELRPEAGLLPPAGTSARAVAYRWLFWLATGLYEADLRYYYPDRYTDDPQGAGGVKRAAVERMDHLLGVGESTLGAGPHVLGEPLSVADFYLFMLVLWHPARSANFDRFPKLGDHARRMRARPSVERIWRQHYPEGGGGPWSTWTISSGS